MLALAADERATTASEFPDERLKLLFVCAHPANRCRRARAADAPDRVRPRCRAHRAGVPGRAGDDVASGWCAPRRRSATPASPSRCRSPRRSPTGSPVSWRRSTRLRERVGRRRRRRSAAPRARRGTLWLASLTAWLLPQEPEALGLTALLLYCDARRLARRAPDGGFVPLSEQDPARWSREMIAQAEQTLTAAARLGRIGPFQLEAAIQSAHVGRILRARRTGPRSRCCTRAWCAPRPTIAALVGRAAAAAEANGCDAGLALPRCDRRARRRDLPALLGAARAPAGARRPRRPRRATLRPRDRLGGRQAVRDYLAKKRDAI